MSKLRTDHLIAVRQPQADAPQPDLPPNTVHPHLMYAAKRAFKSVTLLPSEMKILAPVLLNKTGLVSIDDYEKLWTLGFCYGIFLEAPPKRTWIKPTITKLNRVSPTKKIGAKQAMMDLFGA